MSGYVLMRVPRVVAEVAARLGLTAQEVTPVVHPENSPTIRQRVQAVNTLAETISMDPRGWGVWPDADKRWLLASRLLEMRNRVRSCRIREAAEVAAL